MLYVAGEIPYPEHATRANVAELSGLGDFFQPETPDQKENADKWFQFVHGVVQEIKNRGHIPRDRAEFPKYYWENESSGGDRLRCRLLELITRMLEKDRKDRISTADLSREVKHLMEKMGPSA